MDFARGEVFPAFPPDPTSEVPVESVRQFNLDEAKELDPLNMPIEGQESVRVRRFEIKGQEYTIPDEPYTSHQKAIYDQLSETQKVRFNELRVKWVQSALRLLNHQRLTVGFGLMVGDKVTQLFKRKREANPIDELAQQGELNQAQGQSKKPTLRERGAPVIQAMVKKLNEEFFTHAGMVVNGREFGVSLSAGAHAGVGVMRKGLFGGLKVGVSLGFDLKRKTLAFEIFTDTETYSRSLPGYGKIAVVPIQLQGYIANFEDHSAAGEARRGLYRKPKGPLGVFDTPNAAYVGSLFALSFPPPIINPTLYLETKGVRRPWLRVTIGPGNKAFIAVEGQVVEGAKYLLKSVPKLIAKAANVIRRRQDPPKPPGDCGYAKIKG